MPKTKTTKNRAAYLRAYRAARATPAAPVHCRCCHAEFAVERSDARYCSDSCRAAAWRPITHRHAEHSPDGWVIPANQSGAGGRQRCAHVLPDRTFCWQPATWLGMSCTNRHRHGVFLDYRCETHVEQPWACDADAACHRGARCPARAVSLAI